MGRKRVAREAFHVGQSAGDVLTVMRLTGRKWTRPPRCTFADGSVADVGDPADVDLRALVRVTYYLPDVELDFERPEGTAMPFRVSEIRKLAGRGDEARTV